MARLLTMKGANYTLKNSLGDSPIGNILFNFYLFELDLAKRYGNHEITMLFNSAASSNGSSLNGSNNSSFIDGGGSISMRKTK
jgi:hypothetical protein